MKYMLLMYANESETPKTPEEYQAIAQAWTDVGQELSTAGVLLSTNGLDPIANATTVRVRDGKQLITAGPVADTHEQLGGYYLLDCKDIDEVIDWAAKVPTAQYGSIEIRPLNQWSQKG